MNLIFNLVLPVVVMVALNIRIYRAMNRFSCGGSAMALRTLHQSHVARESSAANDHNGVGVAEGMRRTTPNERELKKR
jgi:hypothetical protein